MSKDPWKHRSKGMLCATCMWWVLKEVDSAESTKRVSELGRCRKNAPLANKGFAPTFANDWCGDHRLDENKI